ncbi:MAG: hypothetical protein ACOZF2_09380 [Thermodesulfobacteriota bacterium]
MVNFDSQQQASCHPHIRGGEGVWEKAEERRRGRRRDQSPGPTKNRVSASLVLIGTVHGDPRGYERVIGLLERLRPETVTVEISRFSLRYRRDWEGRWQRQLQETLAALPPGVAGHPAIRMVAAQIALPFEYRAARDYSRRYGAKCLPLDLGGLSRRHLPVYSRELLSPANLQALAAEPQESLEEAVDREFRRARSALERPLARLPLSGNPETRRREFFVSRRLKRLVAKGGRVAHLGGWEHLIPREDGEGLRSWLEEQKPYVLLADTGDLLA